MSPEHEVATRMLGDTSPLVTMTDAYKLSMGQAGFPLRQESFYLSFRRPGRYFIPFDLPKLIEPLTSPVPLSDSHWLDRSGFGLTSAMRSALGGKLDVWAAPKGSWVREREPIITVTGPSFLASWLEPLAIWLHWPIQIATACTEDGLTDLTCVTEDEAEIARLAAEAVGCKLNITIDLDGYQDRVREHRQGLLDARASDDVAIFEVGMRGATCMATHEAALTALCEDGWQATSNVYLAMKHGLAPVGTTGHEHQQRWGDDLTAFRAIRDMRPQIPGFLFDTYDAIGKGIPAAVQAMREAKGRLCGVRFDSGDQMAQLRAFVEAERGWGIQPNYCFMDGISPAKVRAFEDLTVGHEISPARRTYGVGGYLVARTHPSEYTRDRVAAVYKLCQSGHSPVMKFSVPTKESVPGVPVIFRSDDGTCLIGQQGEIAPPGFSPLHRGVEPHGDVNYSPATEVLIRSLKAKHGLL